MIRVYYWLMCLLFGVAAGTFWWAAVMLSIAAYEEQARGPFLGNCMLALAHLAAGTFAIAMSFVFFASDRETA